MKVRYYTEVDKDEYERRQVEILKSDLASLRLAYCFSRIFPDSKSVPHGQQFLFAKLYEAIGVCNYSVRKYKDIKSEYIEKWRAIHAAYYRRLSYRAMDYYDRKEHSREFDFYCSRFSWQMAYYSLVMSLLSACLKIENTKGMTGVQKKIIAAAKQVDFKSFCDTLVGNLGPNRRFAIYDSVLPAWAEKIIQTANALEQQ